MCFMLLKILTLASWLEKSWKDYGFLYEGLVTYHSAVWFSFWIFLYYGIIFGGTIDIQNTHKTTISKINSPGPLCNCQDKGWIGKKAKLESGDCYGESYWQFFRKHGLILMVGHLSCELVQTLLTKWEMVFFANEKTFWPVHAFVATYKVLGKHQVCATWETFF